MVRPCVEPHMDVVVVVVGGGGGRCDEWRLPVGMPACFSCASRTACCGMRLPYLGIVILGRRFWRPLCAAQERPPPLLSTRPALSNAFTSRLPCHLVLLCSFQRWLPLVLRPVTARGVDLRRPVWRFAGCSHFSSAPKLAAAHLCRPPVIAHLSFSCCCACLCAGSAPSAGDGQCVAAEHRPRGGAGGHHPHPKAAFHWCVALWCRPCRAAPRRVVPASRGHAGGACEWELV